MLAIPLTNSLGANDSTSFCVDERGLESDEERADLGGPDFDKPSLALAPLITSTGDSKLVCDNDGVCSVIHVAHLQRGPPCS